MPRADDLGAAEPELALAEGMAFEGLLVLPKGSRIDGRVAGEVLAGGPLWVGPSGVVEADLEVESVLVEGHVTGDVRAQRAIELGPGAIVRGNLSAPVLRMAEGARVDGRCACGDPGRSAADSADPPPAGSPPAGAPTRAS